MGCIQYDIWIYPYFFCKSAHTVSLISTVPRRHDVQDVGTLTHLCQCLTIASVESTIVPSMSNNNPAKEWICVGPVNIRVPVELAMAKTDRNRNGGFLRARLWTKDQDRKEDFP